MRSALGLFLLSVHLSTQVIGPVPAISIKLEPFYASANQKRLAHKLASPTALAASPSGNVYVFDGGNSRIVKLDRAGRFIREFGGPENRAGRIRSGGLSDALAVDKDETIYVLDPIDPKVQIFNSNGRFIRSFRLPFIADNVAVNTKGEIFLAPVTAKNGPLIYVFSKDGRYLRSIGKRLVAAEGRLPQEINRVKLAVDRQDNLLVAFRSWPLIRKYTRFGKLIAESSFRIPSALMDEAASKNYSLEFFEKHPEASFVLPLLVHSITATRNSGYILLNGHVLIKLGRDGTILKEFKLQLPDSNERLFISLAAEERSNRLLLLDTRSSSIYAIKLDSPGL